MKNITLMITIGVLFLSFKPVFGHPPSSLKIEFNLADHVLKVDVLHEVKDPAKHFIYKVAVDLNGKEIIKQTFKTQRDSTGLNVIYMIIDAKVGDEIGVTGFCSISGKKKETIKVQLPENPEGTPEK